MQPLAINPSRLSSRVIGRAFPLCYDFAMPARILDGTKIRDEVFTELREEIASLDASGIRPGLAAVLVGENPASQLYVKGKIAASGQLGLASWLHKPPASVTTDEVLALVQDLNRNNKVDGILIQLPLPPQVDTKRVLEAVDPAKDVDGFHPVNLGRLVSGRPGLVACTPAGCMEILRRNEIQIAGANAVVLGRSDIVGKPMALLLMHANATVTICHSKTRDLPDMVRRADIAVVPQFPGAAPEIPRQRQCARRRRASRRGQRCRRADSRTRRRWPYDHHDADEQHGESRATPAGKIKPAPQRDQRDRAMRPSPCFDSA